MIEKDKICVIGIWHLGSVYSACLADLGYKIVGLDRDPDRIKNLSSGAPPIFEPGLQEMIGDNILAGKLTYSNDFASGLKGAGYVLITYDTAVDENDEVDLSIILETAQTINKNLEDGAVLVVSSQVPVGTCDRIKSLVKQENPSLDFDVACCPENLRLGQAIDYFKNPDRIVIGADSELTLDRVEDLFHVISSPVIRMNLRSAEMTKHAINTFLSACISFANEIANLSDEVGADALKVAEALKSEARIGSRLPLLPGLAFSGGTLARDLKILKKLGQNNDCETPLINGILRVNELQNGVVLRKLNKIYGGLKGLSVGVLGLTYKAGTSTLRRSAAVEIIKDLKTSGATVRAYDPKADPDEVRQHDGLENSKDPYAVARGSDALVIVTAWPEFMNLDFPLIKSIMQKPVIIDAMNMLDAHMMSSLGFVYAGIGTGEALGTGVHDS